MTLITLDTKPCSICNASKPLLEFYPNKHASDGHHSECKECHKLRKRVFWWRNRERLTEERRRRHIGIKVEVLTHYGRGELACVYCGYFDIRALTLDHIEGGGNIERRRLNIPRGGIILYTWLKNKGYPKGYQTLCANCQSIKRIERGEW